MMVRHPRRLSRGSWLPGRPWTPSTLGAGLREDRHTTRRNAPPHGRDTSARFRSRGPEPPAGPLFALRSPPTPCRSQSPAQPLSDPPSPSASPRLRASVPTRLPQLYRCSSRSEEKERTEERTRAPGVPGSSRVRVGRGWARRRGGSVAWMVGDGTGSGLKPSWTCPTVSSSPHQSPGDVFVSEGKPVARLAGTVDHHRTSGDAHRER